MEENKNIEPNQPAENIPKEDIASDKIDVSVTEAAVFEQPQTTNYKPQTEDMEVHHHTHPDSLRDHSNPPAGRAGKNWRSYFWEFLMLFLAVFCGFLAEYQLEHKIEKNREKQFMQSMVEDLKADVASIDSVNRLRDARYKMYDSLSKAILENTYAGNGASVYFWGRSISRRTFFYSADGTMQQLKNSGGLRLINNKSIADKIIAYDVLYRSILRQQELVQLQISDYQASADNVFDAAVFKKMTILENVITIERPEGNPQLKDNSPIQLNEIANKLNYWATGSAFLRQLLEELREKAEHLIESIQKTYHLK
jgi:hypothetical protein